MASSKLSIWYSNSRPKTLDGVVLEIEDPQPIPQQLDSGIINLVKAVNLRGLPTSYSCEGHLDGRVDADPSPRVGFQWSALHDRKTKKLKDTVWEFKGCVREFNEVSPVKWRFDTEHKFLLKPEREAVSLWELKNQQRSADELAEHLFADWILHSFRKG